MQFTESGEINFKKNFTELHSKIKQVLPIIVDSKLAVLVLSRSIESFYIHQYDPVSNDFLFISQFNNMKDMVMIDDKIDKIFSDPLHNNNTHIEKRYQVFGLGNTYYPFSNKFMMYIYTFGILPSSIINKPLAKYNLVQFSENRMISREQTHMPLYASHGLDNKIWLWFASQGNVLTASIFNSTDEKGTLVKQSDPRLFDTHLYKNKTLNWKIYPNPINTENFIKVSYQIKEPTQIRMEIYNLKGDLIKEIKPNNKELGNYNQDVNITGFKSGVYLIRFIANGEFDSKLFLVN